MWNRWRWKKSYGMKKSLRYVKRKRSRCAQFHNGMYFGRDNFDFRHNEGELAYFIEWIFSSWFVSHSLNLFLICHRYCFTLVNVKYLRARMFLWSHSIFCFSFGVHQTIHCWILYAKFVIVFLPICISSSFSSTIFYPFQVYSVRTYTLLINTLTKLQSYASHLSIGFLFLNLSTFRFDSVSYANSFHLLGGKCCK